MQVRSVSFCFSLWLVFPSVILAEDALSDCIGTHFNEYYYTIGSHRSVPLERIQIWSDWCKKGYNATQIAQAIRPCYQEKIHLIQQQAGGFLPITYEKSQKIKQYCTQELGLSLRTTPNNLDQSIM